MALQIIGGDFRGFTLKVVESKKLRPTSVMLKRKIFDAHQNMEHFHFIDCFAGSGAIGIEALSRGATQITLIENHPRFYQNIKENLFSLSAKFSIKKDQIRHEKADFLKYITKFKLDYQKQCESIQLKTILFWDPPYELHKLYFALNQLFDSSWYKGLFWIESDKFKGPAENLILGDKLKFIKKYSSSQQYILVCSMA